jgi:hypothetical protein
MFFISRRFVGHVEKLIKEGKLKATKKYKATKDTVYVEEDAESYDEQDDDDEKEEEEEEEEEVKRAKGRGKGKGKASKGEEEVKGKAKTGKESHVSNEGALIASITQRIQKRRAEDILSLADELEAKYASKGKGKGKGKGGHSEGPSEEEFARLQADMAKRASQAKK